LCVKILTFVAMHDAELTTASCVLRVAELLVIRVLSLVTWWNSLPYYIWALAKICTSKRPSPHTRFPIQLRTADIKAETYVRMLLGAFLCDLPAHSAFFRLSCYYYCYYY